jgi:diguanylate cyclase (GGDEF)-like protein
VPLVAVASLAALILAIGPASSGVGIVILVPLLWTSLYHRRWESYVVVGALVLAELLTSLTPVHVADAVLLRRIVFWSALSLLIAIGTNALRDRLRGSIAQRDENLQRTVGFAAAAEELTTRLEPDEVVTVATRLAAQLISPEGGPGRRAQYSRVIDGMLHTIAQSDETGLAIVAPFPVSEQPNVVEAIRSESVIQRPLDPERFGPAAAEIIRSLGVTESVYIPVHFGGSIDGVLSIPMRGSSVGPDLLDFCRAFGHLVELALGNAYVHQDLAAQATTDHLTGLPNQRAFASVMANPPGRTKFAIMAIDLDGLKQVNDVEGHGAGDQMLIQAACILKDATRQGDVVARVGGDEFAAFLFDATVEDAVSVGQRILATAPGTAPGARKPSLSIGIAAGDASAEPAAILGAADKAMYGAKSEGGSRLAIARESI